ncbi:flagellar biosynthesis protein FlhA [Jatrophihabitans endophyticus]|uniref:Flagellar biosynthesis protein FlhA n=1 Tax=Jatrophihabitans endophyticus TaxID=1206085 RepID=A0A1M5IKB0_9ACTN|nr:flagellar biosynthesis protein FlhA [Jatrophihabitans endophyticus]SHG28223.1 flagellar biosynthesis protein FlhA [Jatrophihabitans endophyticus]
MKPSRLSQLAVPIGVVSIVVMLVVPMPATLLDILIAGNMTGAVLVVLTSMYVKRPLEFSSFPSLLLIATLLRLALNISATRLVLTDGFAGNVINAFGHFVIGGSLVIGLVIFAILLVIQFVVITNGAGRVAEVGARFTLDAMPGKQMAIDADLNAGLIDEQTARTRRAEIASEADFYGAMDGATRFVKGDAIAAILITFINLIGGFAIGVLEHGIPVSEALSKYSLLSIGDGLVSQIPALLLSVSTGLIVTRSSDSDDMGTVVSRQLGNNRKALQIAGAGALGLCLVPGLPKLPFLLVGGALLFMASKRKAAEAVEAAEAETAATGAQAAPAQSDEDALRAELAVDPLELVLSPDLVSLVSGAGADLLDRVKLLRRSLATELGVVMPPVRTRDNVSLPQSTYAININGVEVARGLAPAGTALAIGDGIDGLPGREAREPVFGVDGKWIPVEMRGQAELLGATVVDRSSLIITHLSEAVRQHASRLLGREDVAAATKALKRTHPVVVEDLTPALLSLGEIQRVLHALLDESVSIRDLVRIFEALSVAAKGGTDPDRLVEAARAALAPALVAGQATAGTLDVLTIEPRLQQTLLESVRPSEGGAQLVIEPGLAELLMSGIAEQFTTHSAQGSKPVLVCAAQIRMPLRRLLRLSLPGMAVLSYPELAASSVSVNALGVIDDVRNLVP